MITILDGFLIRAYAVLFGIVAGAVSTMAVNAVPETAWRSTQHVLTSCIPLAVRPLSFRNTHIAHGLDWNGRGYEASDGARLVGEVHGFDSIDAAKAYMQSSVIENRTVVERIDVYDECNQGVGERIVAERDQSAIVAWREGATVRYAVGPTLTHVKALLEAHPYP